MKTFVGENSGRNIPWLAKDSTGPDITLAFDDNRLASLLFGQYDQNLAFIEKRLGVSLTARGNQVEIAGPQDAVDQSRSVLESLYQRLKGGQGVELGDVDGAIRMTTAQHSLFEADGAVRMAHEEIVTRKRRVRARTPAQDAYIRALKKNELVFGTGPAGTGKTWLAVAQAVACLDKGLADRLILTRPAVEAGERLGFLPGDMKEKVDPYLRPIYDALYDLMDAQRVERGLQSGMIEIAPLAFMRGRTLTNAVIILDEAQNTTSMQMKMALTRIGENSRMIVTGDPTQIDLPPGMTSGLVEAMEVLTGVEGIGFAAFDENDVVRHELVGRVVKAYEAATRAGRHDVRPEPRGRNRT